MDYSSISSKKPAEDDEPEYDPKLMLLSWYDSDLNLKINKANFLEAEPMHNEGFAFIWAGARASFGVTGGMSYFEVKVNLQYDVYCELQLEKYLDVSHLINEESPHVVRVGWSVPSASMQLALSFGYGGTGKVSCNNKFRDYGGTFQEGDVVTVYLDMSTPVVRMSFAVNGKDFGVAFEVPIEKLENKPLFPHVITKNCKFCCNFGSEKPSFPVNEGFVPVSALKEDQLVAGPKRPEKRSDCEMIMLCGLPGCGKTMWASKYAAKHPERNYNILGTNNLIDKMRVMGLNRRRNYAGRWDELIKQCTNCLNHLLTVASGRRRNYILDQVCQTVITLVS
ncbi:hypothetical protein B566_EDAN000899 [Ephemera danica]|nr:hypothetical protein B566_EDAN000899 [Ephemera danica]